MYVCVCGLKKRKHERELQIKYYSRRTGSFEFRATYSFYVILKGGPLCQCELNYGESIMVCY
jgi:hypothetical protein